LSAAWCVKAVHRICSLRDIGHFFVTLINKLDATTHLGAAQGAGEERIEPYTKHTVREYHSQQRRDAPRAVGATGFAGWQNSGVKLQGGVPWRTL
jgi:hypothetical protein